MSAGVREGPSISTAYGRPVLPASANVNFGVSSSSPPSAAAASSLSSSGVGVNAAGNANVGSTYGYGIASGVCMGLGLLAARAWRRRKKVTKEKNTAARGRSDSVSSSGRSISIRVGDSSAHRVRSTSKRSTLLSSKAVAVKSLPNFTTSRTSSSQNEIVVPGSPAALPLDFDLLKSLQKPLMEVALMFRALFKLIPGKYLQQIGEVLPELTKGDSFSAKGLPPFMFPRAMVSLLVSKATLPDNETELSDRHAQIAGIVEHIHIAGRMHTGTKLTTVFKEDGRMLAQLVPSFTSLLSALGKGGIGGISASRVQKLMKMALGSGAAKASSDETDASEKDKKPNLKLSLLGGDCLFAQGQWSLANLDSAESRKVITHGLAQLSDCESRKRDAAGLSINEYLELERTGFPGVLSSAVECAALVNHVDPKVVYELTQFGRDLGLIISAWQDVQKLESHIPTTLPTIPSLFSKARGGQTDQDVIRLGVPATKKLVIGLAKRAAARLQCLKDSPSRKMLEGLAGAVSKACSELCTKLVPGEEDVSCEELSTLLPDCIKEPIDNIANRCATLRETTRAQLAESRLEKVKSATVDVNLPVKKEGAPDGWRHTLRIKCLAIIPHDSLN